MYKRGAQAIIRPKRAVYDLRKIKTDTEIPGFGVIERTSIAFPNPAGDTLFGSFYRAEKPFRNSCVVYLHGNASNQLEGRFIISYFVPLGISVFCFDFSGCGCSTGKYVTLGPHEMSDLRAVVSLLREDFNVEHLGIWGRSMGAAVALMALSDETFGIDGVVVDSPYASVIALMERIAAQKHVPRSLQENALAKIRKIVLKKAEFDVLQVKPIDACERITKPVFFIHARGDRLVSPEDGRLMFDTCRSAEKEFCLVEGAHNSKRPKGVVMSAAAFLCKALGLTVIFHDSEGLAEDNRADQHVSNADDLLESSC